MRRTVAGIDSSTQSCTLEVRDVDTGELVARGTRPHPPTTPPRSEQEPSSWWAALAPLLDEHAGDVAALSVAGQQHGLVALGADRAVLRPAKLWNDTESAPQAAALVERLGAGAWASRTGSVPLASMTITKLAWMAEHEPDRFARIAHVLLPHDWLTMQLCGGLVTDRGDSSGTGYWSPASQDWCSEVLDLVGLDVSVCPTVLGPAEPAGRWGGAVVGPGTGDNMAAALGTGLRPGDVAVSIGTSGVVCAVSPAPTADATGAVAGFADATGRYLPLVCTLNAAKVTDAVGRLLGVDHDELSALALAEPAGSGGVVVVPYLDGERTPNLPDATGAITGLRSDVRRGQLARAAVEGVVCGLLDALDALGAAGVDVSARRLVLTGGGARSAAFRRILADLADRPVEVFAGDDHVARGACVQAAAVLAAVPPEQVAAAWEPAPAEIVEPSGRTDVDAVRSAYAEASRPRD